MALINCPECGKEISDSSEKCIYCGYPLKTSIDKKLSYKVVITVLSIIFVIAIIVIVLLVFIMNSGTSNKKEICSVDGCGKAVYLNESCIEHFNYAGNGNTTVTNTEVSTEDNNDVSSLEEGKDDKGGTKDFKDDNNVNNLIMNVSVYTNTTAFSIDDYSIASKIEPINCTKSIYSYYEASNGNVFIDVKFWVKNERKQAIAQDKVFSSVKIYYDDDYEYRCSMVTVDKDGDFEGYTSLYSINPLESLEYHMIVEVPDEVKYSDKSLKVQVVLDGEIYECKLR